MITASKNQDLTLEAYYEAVMREILRCDDFDGETYFCSGCDDTDPSYCGHCDRCHECNEEIVRRDMQVMDGVKLEDQVDDFRSQILSHYECGVHYVICFDNLRKRDTKPKMVITERQRQPIRD